MAHDVHPHFDRRFTRHVGGVEGKGLGWPGYFSNRAVLGNECNADLVRSGFAFCFRGGHPILPLPKCLSVDGMPCTEPTTSFPT